MALAVLFLLVGMLFAELSLFGVDGLGIAGAGLLAIAAFVLIRNREQIEHPWTR